MTSSAASSSTGAAAASSSAAPRWPWVSRDKNDDPLDPMHKLLPLPNLPHRKSLADFAIDIPPTDTSFHAWNTFRNARPKLRDRVKHEVEKKRRWAAEAFHEFGLALMDAEDRPNRWAEARATFAHDYVLSRNLANPSQDVLPALRQMSVCAMHMKDWHDSVLCAEQAITDAVKARDPEERQAAYVHLGNVILDWLEHVGSDERFDTWGVREREQLLDRMTHCFKRADVLAKGLRITADLDREKRHNILTNSTINLANSVELRIKHVTQQQMHVRRMADLQAELEEDLSALYTPLPSALLLTERSGGKTLACFAPQTPFALRTSPSPDILALYREAKPFLKDGEKLCFSADADEEPPLKSLPLSEWEIDEVAPYPSGVDVMSLSRVLHTHGMVLEAVGELDLALDQYILSARRLNCLKRLASTQKATFERMIEGQRSSIKNCLLVYMKQNKWPLATKMANQLRALAQRGLDREKKDGAKGEHKDEGEDEDEEEDEDGYAAQLESAKNMLMLIKAKQKTHEQLAQNAQQIAACESIPSSRNSPAHYSLIRARRDIYLKALEMSNDQEEDESTRGLHAQAMLNCERQMWLMLRLQRRGIDRARSPDAWMSSLQQEGHLLISLAQSASGLAKLLFKTSPSKSLERKFVESAWQLVRGWILHVLGSNVGLGRPMPHWEGMALAQTAECLERDVRALPSAVAMLRIEALNCMDRCKESDAPVFARLLKTRADIAKQLALSYEQQLARKKSDPKLAQFATQWSNTRLQLQNAWAKLQREAKSDESKRLLVEANERMDDEFEGKDPSSTAAAAADASMKAEGNDEEENQPAAATAVMKVEPKASPPPAKPAALTQSTLKLAVKQETPPSKGVSAPAAPAAKAATPRPSPAQPAVPPVRTAAAAIASPPAAAAPKRSVHFAVADSEEDTPAASTSLNLVDLLQSGAGLPESQSDDEMSSGPAPAAAAPSAVAVHPPRKRRRVREDGSQSPVEGDEPGLRDVAELGGSEEVVDVTDEMRPAAKRAHRDCKEEKTAPAPPVAASGVPSPAVAAPVAAAPVAAVLQSSVVPSVIVPAVPTAPLAPVYILPPAPALNHGLLSICSESREELVVAVRRLHKENGTGMQLLLRSNIFAQAAVDALCLVLRTPPSAAPEAIRPLGCVHTVDASFSRVEGDAGWSHILVALPKLPRLKLLNLSFTSVGSWCTPHLHACVSRSRLLRVLRLDGCVRLTGHGPVGDEGAKLAAALTSNASLQELSLSGGSLSPVALAHLLRAFRRLPELTRVNLSYQRVMCFRLRESDETSILPEQDDGPWGSEEEARESCRQSCHTSVLLCASDATIVRDVYAALDEWLTSSHPAAVSTLRVSLAGWSCGLGLMEQLCALLVANTCRVRTLDLTDSDLSEAQASKLILALAANSRGAKSFERLLYSPLNERAPGAAKVQSLLLQGMPASMRMDSAHEF